MCCNMCPATQNREVETWVISSCRRMKGKRMSGEHRAAQQRWQATAVPCYKRAMWAEEQITADWETGECGEFHASAVLL